MNEIERTKLIIEIIEQLKTSFKEDQIRTFFKSFAPSAYFHINMVTINSYTGIDAFMGEILQYMDDRELKKTARRVSINTDNLVKMPVKSPPPANTTTPAIIPAPASPNPKNALTKKPLAFISYKDDRKDAAIKLARALEKYDIEVFVAEKDLSDCEEWQRELLEKLRDMDFFISVHTNDFSKSSWCQQEVGGAFVKGVKTIAIKVDEDPDGFIGKYTAIKDNGTVEELVKKILAVLEKSLETKELYYEKIAPKVAELNDESDESDESVEEIIQGATGRFSDRFSDRFDTGRSQKSRQLGDRL